MENRGGWQEEPRALRGSINRPQATILPCLLNLPTIHSVADGGGGCGAVVVEEWWENRVDGGGRTEVGKHTVFRSAGERTVVVVVVREQ